MRVGHGCKRMGSETRRLEACVGRPKYAPYPVPDVMSGAHPQCERKAKCHSTRFRCTGGNPITESESNEVCFPKSQEG